MSHTWGVYFVFGTWMLLPLVFGKLFLISCRKTTPIPRLGGVLSNSLDVYHLLFSYLLLQAISKEINATRSIGLDQACVVWVTSVLHALLWRENLSIYSLSPLYHLFRRYQLMIWPEDKTYIYSARPFQPVKRSMLQIVSLSTRPVPVVKGFWRYPIRPWSYYPMRIFIYFSSSSVLLFDSIDCMTTGTGDLPFPIPVEGEPCSFGVMPQCRWDISSKKLKGQYGLLPDKCTNREYRDPYMRGAHEQTHGESFY